MRSRARLLLALLMLSPLATRAAATQQLGRSQAPALAPFAVQWSLPTSHVTRHIPSWSATDIGLATGFLATLWIDAAQTRALARQGWTGFHENNPILGQTPSVAQINRYTAAAAVATLGIAAVLPPRARRWWLASAFVVEASTVIYTTTSVGVAFTLH